MDREDVMRKLKKEDRVVHRAKDLLLGRRISDEEAVSVRAVVPPAIIPSQLSREDRAEALRRLDRYFAKVDASRKPVSEQEEEAIMLEAIRSVRPDYRPLE